MYRLFMKLSCAFAFIPCILFAMNNAQAQELANIDARIAKLKVILEKYVIAKQHEEVESQNYVIADWPKYSEEIQDIRQKELAEKEILQEIQKLEDRKKQLLQNTTLSR